jgi:hypothetical protein
MTEVAITISPGPNETELICEPCELFSHEMLLTASEGIAIVRVFGRDKTSNAVRLGFAPENAIRVGAAFIRAALRINPALRLQLVEDAIGKPGQADLKLIADKP